MLKKDLRHTFLQRRKALSLEWIDFQSEQLAHQLVSYFDLTVLHYLHLFLPILEQREINTWRLIERLQTDYPHLTLVTSKSDFKKLTMSNYVLEPGAKIIKNAWGIPEPVGTEPVADQDLEMVLLPLLCFDKQLFRVGYGKGFYDKFLIGCKPDIIKVGLSLFAPVEIITDIQWYDQQMDYCLTPEQVWTADNR